MNMNKDDMLDVALEMIGTPGRSPKAQAAREVFAPRIESSEDRSYESYDSLGVSVIADLNEDLVISISFFGRTLNRWQGDVYTGPLPHGLSFEMSPDAIHRRLGEPMKRGMNWEMWDFGDYTLRTEHNSKCEGPLRVVTLGLG